MFLKNFVFFKKYNIDRFIFLNIFKKHYFYYFYNLYYLFIYFNYFFINNIFNFSKKYYHYNTLYNNIVIEDESKKKKVFVKLLFYIKNNFNIYHNNFNLNLILKKKINFFKKIYFFYNFFLQLGFFFSKTKSKKKKLNYYFFKLLFFYNFFLLVYINIYTICSSIFFKNLFFYKKINFFYKTFFNNLFFFKNSSKCIFNKNAFLLNTYTLLDNFKINFFFLDNQNYLFNNQYPLIFFKKFNKNIFKKFNLKKKIYFLNLFNLYILNFLEFFFKKNFFLKISNKIQPRQFKKIYLFLQNYSNNTKFQKFVDYNEMLELICIVFLYKDMILFKNWLIYTLNNITIKNHKKFFMILNEFIVDNFSIFSNIFNIKGFYFCVKGKIGLSGNAKKKKIFFKTGFLKISSKNIKIDSQRFFIKTNCGSLGINTILTY